MCWVLKEGGTDDSKDNFLFKSWLESGWKARQENQLLTVVQ